MPKGLMQRIEEIQADTSGASIISVQTKALDLILKLVNTPEWNEFIGEFVDGNDNPALLARLKLQDRASLDPYIRKTVGYMIGNATCGMGTPMRLGESLEVLDPSLDGQSGTEPNP